MAQKSGLLWDEVKQKRIIKFLYWFIGNKFILTNQPLLISEKYNIRTTPHSNVNFGQRPHKYQHQQTRPLPYKKYTIPPDDNDYNSTNYNIYHPNLIINGNTTSQAKKLNDICFDIASKSLRDNTNEVSIKYNNPFNAEKMIEIKSHQNKMEKSIYEVFMEIHSKHTLPDEYYSWIEPKNSRQINFIWGYIRTAQYSNGNLYSDFRVRETEDNSSHAQIINYLYDQILPQFNSESISEKLEYIKNFFDFWDVSIGEKQKGMRCLEKRWIEVSRDSKITQWVDLNKDLLPSIWRYVVNKFYLGQQPNWVIITSSDEKERNSQIKASLITFYDLLNSPSEKRDLFKHIKSNASDKRYDVRTAESERQLNTKIKTESKLQLDQIAKTKKMTVKATVEWLIENGFRELIENNK